MANDPKGSDKAVSSTAKDAGGVGQRLGAIRVEGKHYDKVRVIAPGPSHVDGLENTFDFQGDTFKPGHGEVVSVGELGWTEGDLVKAKQAGIIIHPPDRENTGKNTIEPPFPGSNKE